MAVIFAFIFISSATAAVFSADSLEDGIIAVVNDEAITQSDLREILAVRYMQISSRYSGQRLKEEMAKAQRQALNRLIEDRLILAEARRQEIQVPEYAVEQKMAQMKKKFADDHEFRQSLSEQGLTVYDLRERISDQLMMAVAVENNVKAKIKVSPVEITAYYQANQSEFSQPASAEVDSIFSESRERIRDAHIALEQGDDFYAVAKIFSQGTSLKMVRKGELLPEVERAIFSLRPQEVSDIVPAGRGFYIFRLLKMAPASNTPLSGVERKIREIIFRKKIEKMFRRWIKELRDKAYIVIK
ncbi:MAG: SurA N-terminal domain-containing protein [Candidatus Omnitrophota bacterium]